MDNGERDREKSLERRVASLEETVRTLASEIQALRGGVRPERSAPPAAPAPVPPRKPKITFDVESVIGRYGTLVLATITALAAVGTFLGWAVSKGWLGPTQRVALGLITAAALAAAGFRLRARERSFGASLLGLSLAVTLVCAWAAGPSLRLVSPSVAFLLAALASIALTIFAHREGDEALWSVGFSGAALAPFVTASGKSDLLLLAGYGAVVIAASGYAMGKRPWFVAGRLFLLAAAAYTVALALGAERDLGPLIATAFPLVIAIAGVAPWLDGWHRRERLRALGALAAVAGLRTGIAINLPFDRQYVAVALAAAGLIWLVLVDRTHRVVTREGEPTRRRLYEGDWLDAGVLPLGFILGAMMAFDASARLSGVAMAIAAAVLLVTVARLPQGALRDAAVFATSISALVSALLILSGRPLALTYTVTAMSAACFLANRAWRSASWTTLGLIGFVWAFFAVLAQLTTRPPYVYAPFLTAESGAGAALVVAVAIAWRAARDDSRIERLLGAGIFVSAFVWVHQEIAFAFGRTASTLLLVTYYAATSVAAVGAGRARRIPLLRHVGLGLAVLAAGTALYGARHLDAIAARIVADLVAAAFLLAIAYWYRRPGGLRTGT